MVNTYSADISDKGFGLIINSVYTQRPTTMMKGLCVLNCNDKILCIQIADLIKYKTCSATRIHIVLKIGLYCFEKIRFGTVRFQFPTFWTMLLSLCSSLQLLPERR
jgi:hypothetical protein